MVSRSGAAGQEAVEEQHDDGADYGYGEASEVEACDEGLVGEDSPSGCRVLGGLYLISPDANLVAFAGWDYRKTIKIRNLSDPLRAERRNHGSHQIVETAKRKRGGIVTATGPCR